VNANRRTALLVPLFALTFAVSAAPPPISDSGAPPKGAVAALAIGAAAGSGIGRSNSMLESWLAPNSAPPTTSASQARPA